MRVHAALATVALFVSSCATSRDGSQDPGLPLKAAALALTQADTGVYQLYISQDALNNGAEFLLSTSVNFTSMGQPSFKGMLSRVVFFKRADGSVQMLESQKGATLDPALTNPNLIASFEVLSEDSSNVGLDFSAGLTNFSLAYEWNASDSGAPQTMFQGRFLSAKLAERYVDEGKTDDSGRITIRQVARAELGGSSTLELRHFLSAYQPDPSFPSLVSAQDFRWSGFFESGATLTPGASLYRQHVSRFHPDKPLKYAISSNTPAEVREAVRDGIEYWNNALGRHWIEVVDAPEGVTAPNVDYNLVQWVPDRNGSSAYADAQLDPLTGEVRNAQVYLPSAFYQGIEAVVATMFARRVQEIEEPQQLADAQPDERESVHWYGACDFVNARMLEAAELLMLEHGVSAPDVQRTSLDHVRFVVAHEVGHTLGLRHNFAGSLGTNIAPDEVDGLIERYFESFDWPVDKVPGSSVMEYPSFEDRVAIGARIRLGSDALSHDVSAINYLYNDGPAPADSGPLFCTDSQLATALDCSQSDAGADIVDSLHRTILDDLNNVALGYVRSLRQAKITQIKDLFRGVSADLDVAAIYGQRALFARLLSHSAMLLSAERSVGSPNINRKEIHEESLKHVGESVLAAGGYDDFFSLLPSDFDQRFHEQLASLLEQPWIK